MILTEKIKVKVIDSEKYGFNKDTFYPVIGSRPKRYQKEGQIITDYQFLVLNEQKKAVGVFPSKCIVWIMDEKMKPFSQNF